MPMKSFLSYIFKDNDPATTDLFDSNWGNGVTAHLNSLMRSPHITIPSDDRQAQLNLEGSNYYIGPDGITLGYPANYISLINVKRDANLNLQLLYSNVGIWARTVNHNASSLEWTLMASPKRRYAITQGTGASSIGLGRVTEVNGVVTLELVGVFTAGGGVKLLGWIQGGLAPSSVIRAVGITTSGGVTKPAVFRVSNEGWIDTPEGAGGEFHLYVTYTK